MQLQRILDELKTALVDGATDREITGISYDSRRVSPGGLFVAIPGRQVDGHDFIPGAVDRGAVAIVCERSGFVSQRATRVRVPNAREALARLSAAFYQHPSRRLKVIGVTGTNGKTTVAFLVKQILEASGIRTGLLGTIRYEIGDRVIPASRTTPEALDIQHMMAQMQRAGCQACVLEVSSHALDQGRVAGVDFDVGIFTNLTHDHLDYHGSMENYFVAKRKLFDALQVGAKQGAAIINIDDAYGACLSKTLSIEVQMTYGVHRAATLRAADIQLGAHETRLTVQTPAGDLNCLIPLIGRHNIYNTLAAVGAGLALRVDLPDIQRALRTMGQVPGRLETIQEGQPFGVFVDYAHTEDALRNVLTTLREITSGRVLVLFGCGGSRDAGKRPKMGSAAAELANFTLITSDNPRRESAETIAAEIEKGYLDVRNDGYRIMLDRSEAIDSILRLARVGDTVLLAGKGHETYQEFDGTVVPFDDRSYARDTLHALGYGGASSRIPDREPLTLAV